MTSGIQCSAPASASRSTYISLSFPLLPCVAFPDALRFPDPRPPGLPGPGVHGLHPQDPEQFRDDLHVRFARGHVLPAHARPRDDPDRLHAGSPPPADLSVRVRCTIAMPSGWRAVSSTRPALTCAFPPAAAVHFPLLPCHSPMAGTGFLGFLSEPEDQDNSRFKQYWQGSQVNLGEYYEDQKRKVDRMRIENPKGLTQKKNPIRNSSQIRFGDYFYYSGKHMFDTTQAESYDETRLTQPMGEALRLRTAELRAAAEPGYLPRTASSASSGSQATSTMSRPGFVKLDAHGRAKTRLIKSKHTTRVS